METLYTSAMQNIIRQFENIDSESALRTFLEINKFRLADSRSHTDQYVLGAFVGIIDGCQAKVIHRLFDEASVRLTGLDRNQVALELDGNLCSKVHFHGNY